MKININVFERIVRERQDIIKELKHTKDYAERIQLIKELIKVEDEILTPEERYDSSKQINPNKRRKLFENKVWWHFNIKKEEIVGFFLAHTTYKVKFESNILILSEYADKCVVFDENNKYVLMGRRCWEDWYNLKVLYSTKYFKDWDRLFAKHPELKDKLWNFVTTKIKNSKTEELTYIQKMIKERKKEIENLSNPEYIKNKTDILNKEIKEREQEYENIKSTIDEINV